MYKTIAITILAIHLVSCGGSKSRVETSLPLANTPSLLVCSNPYNNNYPNDYMGKFQIPIPLGELDPSITKRGISFKDFFGGTSFKITGERNSNGEPVWSGCTQEEFTKMIYLLSLERMRDSGATFAWVYNYAPWVDVEPDLLEVSIENYQITDEIMNWLVKQAEGMGIEIYFAWQFTTSDISGESFYEMNTTPSLPILKKIMDAHETNIIKQAIFAESIGIKGLAADWNAMNICFCGGNKELLKEYYIERLSIIISKIRNEFGGQILVGQTFNIFNDERIFSKIDMLYLSITGNFKTIISAEENLTLSTELIKDLSLGYFKYEYEKMYCLDGQPCWSGSSKIVLPVMVNYSAQSKDNYFVTGWSEDGFCTEGTLSDGSTVDCIQNFYTTDFSVQAIGMDGMLQAIVQQPYFQIEAVDVHTGYWLADTLVPDDSGFPNLSQSIRGKPAEKIVKYWYTGIYAE